MPQNTRIRAFATTLVLFTTLPFATAQIPGLDEPTLPGLSGLPAPAPKISAEEAVKRAKSITFPLVKYEKKTPQDALWDLRAALQQRAAAHGQKHAELEVIFGTGVMMLPETVQVSLEMKDVTLHAALTEIARQAGLVLSFENGAAQLSTKEEIADRAVVLTPIQKAFLKRAESILPEFKVKDAFLPDLIKTLNAAAREADPQKQGITVELSPGAAANAQTRVTLTLHNVPVSEVIKYIVNLANLRQKAHDKKIVLAAYGEG